MTPDFNAMHGLLKCKQVPILQRDINGTSSACPKTAGLKYEKGMPPGIPFSGAMLRSGFVYFRMGRFLHLVPLTKLESRYPVFCYDVIVDRKLG